MINKLQESLEQCEETLMYVEFCGLIINKFKKRELNNMCNSFDKN